MTGLAARGYASAAAYELDDRGGRHVILLLHGLGGDHHQPLGLTTDRFAGMGATVLAPDARAHGETDLIGSPDRFATANLVEDVLALVERLGLNDRALIPVGISMGAAVGLELITQHPDRVAGGVLIRPSFGPQPWPRHLQVFLTISRLLRAHGRQGLDLFRQSAEYQEHCGVSPTAAASLCDQFTKPRATERVVRLETVPGNTAVGWQHPREVVVPVTVIGAQDDPGHPLAIARLWHRQLAGSQLIEIPSRDKQPQAYATNLEAATATAVRALLQTPAPRLGEHASVDDR